MDTSQIRRRIGMKVVLFIRTNSFGLLVFVEEVLRIAVSKVFSLCNKRRKKNGNHLNGQKVRN